MLYTGIIAALSSLDLGIKWLIEREKPEDFPKPLPHTKEKILLTGTTTQDFPSAFWNSMENLCGCSRWRLFPVWPVF